MNTKPYAVAASQSRLRSSRLGSNGALAPRAAPGGSR